PPDFSVAHLGGDVNPKRNLLESGDVLRVGLPSPIDPLLEQVEWDLLHTREGLGDVIAVARSHWRQRESTVTHYNRGEPVPGGRGQQRVPVHLPVVVGVPINE